MIAIFRDRTKEEHLFFATGAVRLTLLKKGESL